MPTIHRLDARARDRILAGIERALSGRTDLRFGTVFGSVLARDAIRDIDVGIWTTDEADPGLDLQLSVSLQEIAGVPVDVRRLNAAPAPFLFHALRGRVVAAQDPLFLADTMERTARTYLDIAPILRRATKEAFG